MRQALRVGLLGAALLLAGRAALAAPAPIVFLDIAGTDLPALAAFYNDLFGWNISGGAQFLLPVATPLPAVLRQDPTEKRVYIGVPDVAATLEQVKAHGGTIDAPRFAVPGVAVLGLFKDPAGNPMGLVELSGTTVKVP